jgi:oligosaccharide repeat unit polymerase
VNPLFLFVSVWGSAVALYLGGVFVGLFSPVKLGTMAVVVLNVGVFALGYLTSVVFGAMTPEPARMGVSRGRSLDLPLIARALKFTLIMGLVAMTLGFYRVAVVASHFGSGIFDLLMQPQILRLRLVTFIGANIYEPSYLVMIMSLTSSLFSIGFVLLGVFLYTSTERCRYAYACGFLLISLTVGLTNLSRYEVTVNILYLVLAYAFMYARDRRRKIRRALADLLLPLVAVAALFVAIDLLLRKGATYASSDALRGFLFSLYWYIASPLAAFDEFLANFDGTYHFGQSTFFPLYKWLCRFDLAPEPDLLVYGQMTFIPYPANVYTWLRTLYEDFGVLGVAVGPYVLGWVTAAVRTGACRSFPFLNLYAILLVLILFSFYNYALISNQVYLQILFGFLFFNWDLASLPLDHGCLRPENRVRGAPSRVTVPPGS